MNVFAIDFGTGAALAIHGPQGPISKRSLKLPKIKGGRTPAQELTLILEGLVQAGADIVVFEAPTVGSSGAAKEDVYAIVKKYPTVRFATLSSRAVKNYRMDHKIPNPKAYGKYQVASTESQDASHVLDAEILWLIATNESYRLHDVRETEVIHREYTSVRPLDKQLYRGPEADRLMSVLPPASEMREDFAFLIDPKTKEWRRSLVMPFAQAMHEPDWQKKPYDEQRNAFLKTIGFYDAGYPSHYRRCMHSDWAIERTARVFGKKLREQTKEFRKEQLKFCRLLVKELFHKSRARMGTS